jgi:hypothetical protein
MKKNLYRWMATLILLLIPSVLLAIYSGYLYASSLALVTLSILLVYSFKEESKIIWSKILVSIPFVAFILYTFSTKTVKHLTLNTLELVISITIICLCLFIAGFASILILSRTKGEKINE